MSQKFAYVNYKLFSTIMFPFVRDAANLLQVDSHAGDSDKEIVVAMVVGGGAAIATAFQNMESCNNHHNDMNNVDNDDNGL